MSGNSVKTPNTPTFEDAMANFRAQIFYDLFCHLPASIVTYDRTTGLATVQPSLKRVYPSYSVPGGQTTAPYPLIANVPVFVPQAGGGSCGGDPKAGDPCLLLIADRNIDAWRQNGGQQAPPSDRAHSLSDAFAIVGFNPVSAPLVSARLAGEYGIADAQAAVVIKNGKIAVRNGTGTLLTILQTLLTAEEALATALAADPGLNSGSHSAASALVTAAGDAITALQALLYP